MMYSIEDFIDDPSMYVLDIRAFCSDEGPYHLRAEFDDIDELLDTIDFRLNEVGYIPSIKHCVISHDCDDNTTKKGRYFFWFLFKRQSRQFDYYNLYVKYIRTKEDFGRIKKRVEQIVAFYNCPEDDDIKDIDNPYICYDPKLKEIVVYTNESLSKNSSSETDE